MSDDPYVVARAMVHAIDRPSPSFARITFTGDDVDHLGTPGRTFDQRIKIIFPPASGQVPDLSEAGSDWYARWLEIPEPQRGSMRTYTVRDLRSDGEGTQLVVDIVVHPEHGAHGPGSTWASRAQEGDEVLIVGPRRGHRAGGIEFDPGNAGWVMLAGDETAAPAIARILEDADTGTRGLAFIEVPSSEDVVPIAAPRGVDVRWLPRDSDVPGAALIPAVLAELGLHAEWTLDEPGPDDLVWETPGYSGRGADLPAVARPSDRYYWIAGESGVVTTLRRHLVKDLGIDRSQVAFMGYWRRGTSMRG